MAYNPGDVTLTIDASTKPPARFHPKSRPGDGASGGAGRPLIALWLACGAAAGCASDGGTAGSMSAGSMGGASMGAGSMGSVSNENPADDGPSGAAGAFAAPVCASPDLPAPQSIADVVAWINALPKPLSLPCFLETLPRPLQLYASESFFSAQPAAGWRSPRMFLFAGPLVMTIVADGIGSHLLEFGERRSDTKSLKGEIPFPVLAELAAAAPFDHLLIDARFTSCSVCHAEEEPDPETSFTRAFMSRALRPVPIERVFLNELRAEAVDCDAAAEPERCAMLVALFGQGNVVDADFPPGLGTFY